MNGKRLLDTNIFVDYLRGKKSLQRVIDEPGEFYLSSIVLGELYFGANKSARNRYNTDRVELLAGRLPVVSCDQETARYYGRIKKSLLDKGRPIPENDIWIAATALQFSLTLVTRDQHFSIVDGIELEEW